MKDVRRFGPALSIAILGLLASVLILKNLDNCCLWQDEAHTALLAESILHHGLPIGFDGKNYISQALGKEYGPHFIWRWQPWLPYYVVALFFKVFGISTWMARFPFALCGIATIVMVYFFTKRLWGKTPLAILAMALLTLQIPFLLLSRQSHYYSLLTLLTVIGFWSYLGIWLEKPRSAFVFVLSNILIFHTLYAVEAIFLCTVLPHSLVFHPGYFRKILRLSVISTIFNSPGIIWFSHLRYGQAYQSNLFHLRTAFQFTWDYLGLLSQYALPASVLVVAGFMLWRKCQSRSISWRQNRGVDGLAMIGLFLSLLLGVYSVMAPGFYYRFMAPSLPLLASVAAYVIAQCWTFHWLAAGAIFILTIVHQPIGNYFYELSHPFIGPVEGIVDYLNRFGDPRDVVAITYEDLPLKFYTKMRIVGGLTGEDLSPAKTARWIIIRKYAVSEMDSRVRDYIVKNVRREDYEAIALACPDTAFENREDPDFHYYRTVQNESPVILFKRRSSVRMNPRSAPRS